MRVLHLSTSDVVGGAARAAYRLHAGLRSTGVDSQMLVQRKSGDNPFVHSPSSRGARAFGQFRSHLDAMPLALFPRRSAGLFSLGWLPGNLVGRITARSPDIVHLHWVSSGFLRLESLRGIRRPMVWTLHDMWALTGGCHYAGDCRRYEIGCGACPQLGRKWERDLSWWVWRRKQKAWGQLPLTIVTPSRWLAETARQSPLLRDFKTIVIPNGLDTKKFKPIDRLLARQILSLPQNKRLILFGAAGGTLERRKGFDLLQAALPLVAKDPNLKGDVELVVFGASEPAKPAGLPFRVHYVGTLADEISLAILYAAVDVFVAPSREDNLPNTIVEAMGCGTPCVAFNIGGMPDMIEPGRNGYLATPFEVDDLARGIAWVLADQARHQALSLRAREKCLAEFSLHTQAARCLELYRTLLPPSRCADQR